MINQSGWNAGDAALVSGAGFAIGATAGVAAPAILDATSITLAVASAATGSTTLATAATTTYGAATSLAAVDGVVLTAAASKLSGLNLASSSPAPSVPSSGTSTALTSYWPPNREFYGDTTRTHLMPGEIVDRYGYEGGTFVSLKGVPFEARALPPESLTKPYHAYEVMKPIEAVLGITTPAFGQIGFGKAYELPRPVSILLRKDFLQEIAP